MKWLAWQSENHSVDLPVLLLFAAMKLGVIESCIVWKSREWGEIVKLACVIRYKNCVCS